MTNCTFTNNTADLGGGMFNGNSSLTVTDCTFTGNTATSSSGGGGMYNSNGILTVSNCTFTGNMAQIGGGMSNVNSNLTVSDCTFSGNTASSSGGGMSNSSSGIFPTVTDSVFCLNLPEDISGPYFNGGGNIFACIAGACCFGDSCVVVADVDCIAAGGNYQGNNTTCEASNCTDNCPADVDGDGTVGITDFLDLLAAWGPCP